TPSVPRIGIRRHPVSRSNRYDWFSALSMTFRMYGTEDFFLRFSLRRSAFSSPRAKSNADVMYGLETTCRWLKSWYAVRVRRARDRMSSLRAMRIDSFTRSRNSVRSQSNCVFCHLTMNTRERCVSMAPSTKRFLGSNLLGEVPESENPPESNMLAEMSEPS